MENIRFSINELKDKMNMESTFEPDKLDYNNFAKAAFEEYITLLSGTRTFTTFSQLNQYRLYLIIRNCFDGLIPSEDQVSKIFKISITAARTLIRNTESTYCFELKDSLINTLKKIIEKAEKDKKNNKSTDEKLLVEIRSSILISEFNQILKVKYPQYEPIKHSNEVTQYYSISKEICEVIKNGQF